MRKILVSTMSVCAAMLLFVAQTNANSFKYFILYEADMPESMKK